MIDHSTSVCARGTREALLDAYPAARESPEVLRALVYLCFSTRTDDETNDLLLDGEALEWIKGSRLRSGDAGMHVIGRIAEVLPGLQIRNHVKDLCTGAGRARTVLAGRTGIEYHLAAELRRDLERSLDDLDDPVFVLTGGPADRRRIDEARVRARHAYAADSPPAPSETTAYLLRQLNDRPSNGFAPIRKAVPLAIQHVRRSGEMNDAQKVHALRMLRAMSVDPQPFYAASQQGRTDRVFAVNASMAGLGRQLRAVFNDHLGWAEVDLESAQLAVAAGVLHLGKVEAYLRSGASLWPGLVSDLGLDGLTPDVAERVKRALKTGLYASVFGMPRHSIGPTLQKALRGLPVSASVGKGFVLHWIIRSLLDGRDGLFDRIRQGERIESPTGIDTTYNPALGRDERSVAATLFQSYETAVMRAVLEYEAKHAADARAQGRDPDFRVTLWQHDGATIAFTRRRQTHMNALEEAVRLRAASYGIFARLTTK